MYLHHAVDEDLGSVLVLSWDDREERLASRAGQRVGQHLRQGREKQGVVWARAEPGGVLDGGSWLETAAPINLS